MEFESDSLDFVALCLRCCYLTRELAHIQRYASGKHEEREYFLELLVPSSGYVYVYCCLTATK